VYAESVDHVPARVVRSHSLSPASLLSLARELYGHAPRRAHVIGIPAREFDLSEDLSPATRTGIAEAVECVGTMLERS
jgi:Ni,Fe-hydrogenase maturation factor